MERSPGSDGFENRWPLTERSTIFTQSSADGAASMRRCAFAGSSCSVCWLRSARVRSTPKTSSPFSAAPAERVAPASFRICCSVISS